MKMFTFNPTEFTSGSARRRRHPGLKKESPASLRLNGVVTGVGYICGHIGSLLTSYYDVMGHHRRTAGNCCFRDKTL